MRKKQPTSHMIFFKRKPKAEEKPEPKPEPKKGKTFEEIIHPRVLTAEGWRRRMLKKKKTPKNS